MIDNYGGFRKRSVQHLGNKAQRAVLQKSLHHTIEKTEEIRKEYPEWQDLRQVAHEIKRHSLAHLADYLRQFESAASRNGTHVHWAATADDANRIISSIARKNGITRVVKAKSMLTEEIRLRQYLETDGLEVIETDLGEFIIQLADETPSHLTAPALHKSRQMIGRLFAEQLHIAYTDDPVELTAAARVYLREKFLAAEMGITGANFAIARTGTVILVENEGNIRLATTIPRIVVSIVGIEKIIPKVSHLAPFIKLLPPSATGQKMAAYMTFLSGPSPENDQNGPAEYHIILLDNGRSGLLEDPEFFQAAMCIRCGACLNVCPIFQRVSGLAYDSVYPGPIGSILTPLLQGLRSAPDLPFASSLCGRCTESCPVHIDIHTMLLALRPRVLAAHPGSRWQRLLMHALAWLFVHSRQYRRLSELARYADLLFGSAFRRCGIRSWTRERTLPSPAPKSFWSQWRTRRRRLEKNNG